MTATASIVPPAPVLVPQMAKFVEKLLDRQGWVLSCEDMELTTEEVSSPQGLLPVVMWVAGQTLEQIWGPQDLTFRCNNDALCGVVPDPIRPILPASVWLHAIHQNIEDLALNKPSGPLQVDEWFAKWNAAVQAKRLSLLPPAVAPATRLSGS